MPESLAGSQPASHPRRTPVIGIVGGVGPYAGLDLQARVLQQTIATRDQDHLPVVSVSWPGEIADRTAFLLGEADENPAAALVRQLAVLGRAGATVAAIPCNTAHAPAIFDAVEAGLARVEPRPRLLHMIREVAGHLAEHLPGVRTIGVLSTTGTYRVRLYPALLEPLGYRLVAPDEALQTAVIHPAIYDPQVGLKALGRVTTETRAALERGIAALRAQGAEAILLGCTELPLAFPEPAFGGLPLVDPTLVLARALIREVAPERLRAWE